jgi:hypothetical protein
MLKGMTVKVRPPKDVPLSLAIAALASMRCGISTKPKPHERPVSRSVMMWGREGVRSCHTAQRADSTRLLWSSRPDSRHKYA